ncbi:hypothetical protein PsorP6_011627 [Peronosclerospora sorghi]|uniref:Uncharacterized protein n=1 Tax=Peronosclerospora sorghi TaxID=230839 RepID=A0ACC0WKB0_9STRA|nr:hypothetical protein PsorP6_011627 [Peronosclerospora sorghi]
MNLSAVCTTVSYQADVVAVEKNLVQFHLSLSLRSDFTKHRKHQEWRQRQIHNFLEINNALSPGNSTTYYSVTSSSTMSKKRT